MVSSVSDTKKVPVDVKNPRETPETNFKTASGPERVNAANGSLTKEKPSKISKSIIKSVPNASESKSDGVKNIIKFVPNASESKSDEVKTKKYFFFQFSGW